MTHPILQNLNNSVNIILFPLSECNTLSRTLDTNKGRHHTIQAVHAKLIQRHFSTSMCFCTRQSICTAAMYMVGKMAKDRFSRQQIIHRFPHLKFTLQCQEEQSYQIQRITHLFLYSQCLNLHCLQYQNPHIAKMHDNRE